MTINIWPFNPQAMRNKIQPSQIYIAKPINDQRSENNKIDDAVCPIIWTNLEITHLNSKSLLYRLF